MATRILLVDDHTMVREGLRAILEREGSCEVVGEAGSGGEAVALAQELHPDVVVMDVAMADMNGIEATRRILKQQTDVRVVALSSHADRRYVRAILDAGAHGYVLKASACDQLSRAIDAAHRGLKYLSAEVTNGLIDSVVHGRKEGSAYEILGPREREVLQLLAEGLTSAAIGERLGVSTSTVETHRRNLMRKVDIHSVAELTKYAVREGLTSLDAGSEPADPT